MSTPASPARWRSWRPVRKLQVCVTGFARAVRDDRSVAYKTALSLLSIGFCLAYHDWIDLLVVLVATGLMLVAELFNTSLEQLCDFVESAEHERIAAVKDIAAAAAGAAGLVWMIVIAAEAIRLIVTPRS